MIRAGGNNALAVWRKSNGKYRSDVASQRLQGQVCLPLPKVPFKSTVRIILRLFQQSPQPIDVVLVPGLPRQIHAGSVKQHLGFAALFHGDPTLRGFTRMRLTFAQE